MQYDKYSDKLLAQQKNIQTTTIFEILLGYSQHELSSAMSEKDGQDYVTNKGRDKKVTRINFVHKVADRISRQEPTIEDRKKEMARQKHRQDLLIAVEAYSILKKWMGIKFLNDPTGLNLGQNYPTKVFFAWIDGVGVMKMLEDQVEEFRTSERAKEFIRYVANNHSQEQTKQELSKKESQAEEKIEQESAAEAFIKSLKIWNINEVEIIVQQPEKKPHAFSYQNCGFSSSDTNEWKTLLKILNQKEPMFEYGKNRDADKKLLQRVEEKLKRHLDKEYTLSFPEGFKLYDNIKKGVFKFKFQSLGGKDSPKLDLSESSIQELKESLKNIHNDEEKMKEYVAIAKELEGRGVSAEEIESIINFKKLTGLDGKIDHTPPKKTPPNPDNL